LVTPASGPGREKSGRTRYLEVSDLGSESKLRVVSYCFARFYEASGASARNALTSDPVETRHPHVTYEVYHVRRREDGKDRL